MTNGIPEPSNPSYEGFGLPGSRHQRGHHPGLRQRDGALGGTRWRLVGRAVLDLDRVTVQAAQVLVGVLDRRIERRDPVLVATRRRRLAVGHEADRDRLAGRLVLLPEHVGGCCRRVGRVATGGVVVAAARRGAEQRQCGEDGECGLAALHVSRHGSPFGAPFGALVRFDVDVNIEEVRSAHKRSGKDSPTPQSKSSGRRSSSGQPLVDEAHPKTSGGTSTRPKSCRWPSAS